jgi:hypothetical protein
VSNYDGSIVFKEWLPDQPELNNPGLTEASGVVPAGPAYESYNPLLTAGTAMANSALQGVGLLTSGEVGVTPAVYVGTFSGNIYRSAESGGVFGGAWSDRAASSTGSVTGLVQYGPYIIACASLVPVQHHTLGSASNFSTLGSATGVAPVARAIGVIGQFVMVGRIPTNICAVQWSGIDDPLSWPTPSSETAIAQQSGLQELHSNFGEVTAIFGGDQWGIIFQTGGITRVTYVGPPAVFQFDTIAQGIGLEHSNAAVQINRLVYFLCSKGFFVTDGVTVRPLGSDKVTQYFLSIRDSDPLRVINAQCGVDWTNRLIYWNFPRNGDSGLPVGIFVYNFETDRWAQNTDTVDLFIHGLESLYTKYGLLAVGQNKKIGSLSGVPTTAVLTTGEMEPNPGGYAVVQGIKPLVDQTLNGITVAMGTRNDRSSAVSYTAEQTANARSGFANFRTSAKYHRARLTVSGTFNAAQGLEYQATPDGFT